jgi:hypothetical protein
MARSAPDPAYLRERLRYDPETGKLYWRAHPTMPKCWVSRYAGGEAFTSVQRNGYLRGSLDNRRFLAHRVVWALHHGAWPSHEIDHRDHDRTNNRIDNLRERDSTGNKRNSLRSRRNSSGVVGVSWYTREQKWRAHIGVAGKQKTLGLFDSFEAAVRRRKAAEFAYDFDPSHGAAA